MRAVLRDPGKLDNTTSLNNDRPRALERTADIDTN
jgi:hypothetical protein